jgi:hypothetical protein
MIRPDRPWRYRTYVLRCWEEQGYTVGQVGRWRCSLEDLRTGARRGFATWQALMVFLQAELEHDAPSGGAGAEPDRSTDEA